MRKEPYLNHHCDEMEDLKKHLQNYNTTSYHVCHCFGETTELITNGNFYAYSLELSRGINWNKITLTLFLSQEVIPTCIFTINQPSYLEQYSKLKDAEFIVYIPKPEEDWKKELESRILQQIRAIDPNNPIIFSHDFARFVTTLIPPDLKDGEILKSNLQITQNDNPVLYANKKENLNKIFIFTRS